MKELLKHGNANVPRRLATLNLRQSNNSNNSGVMAANLLSPGVVNKDLSIKFQPNSSSKGGDESDFRRRLTLPVPTPVQSKVLIQGNSGLGLGRLPGKFEIQN